MSWDLWIQVNENFKSRKWYHCILSPYAAGGLFVQYKLMQKSRKMTETLANGYSYESTQRELSNEYKHDRV